MSTANTFYSVSPEEEAGQERRGEGTRGEERSSKSNWYSELEAGVKRAEVSQIGGVRGREGSRVEELRTDGKRGVERSQGV